MVDFRLPPTAGTTAHAVMFDTNDPDHPDIRLTVRVMAKRFVEALPSNVYAGVVMAGTSVSHELELCSTDGTPFEVKEVRPSVPWIHVDAVPDRISHRRLFRVTIQGEPTTGAFLESVLFLTTCEKQQQVVVPIRGEIVHSVGVSPSALRLNPAQPRAKVNVRVEIVSDNSAGNTVDSVSILDSDWEVLSWEVEKITDKKERIHICIRVPGVAGYKRTSLVLGDAAKRRSHQLPLTCLVAEKSSEDE